MSASTPNAPMCATCKKRRAVVQASRRLAIISRQTPFPDPHPMCVLCAGDDVEPLGYDPRQPEGG